MADAPSFKLGPIFERQYVAAELGEKAAIKALMGVILQDPLGPGAVPLPPPRMPGTMSQRIDRLMIVYFVEHNDDGGRDEINFVRYYMLSDEQMELAARARRR